MERIAFSLQKGGVGKTAITIHLAGAFAERGKRVLLVDLDGQGGLTEGIGRRDAYGRSPSIVDALTSYTNGQQVNPQDLLVSREPFDLIPAHRDIAQLSERLGQDRAWFRRLDQLLSEIEEPYDYVLIDAPPELSRVSDSALIAAGNVVIPMIPEEPAARGLEKMVTDQIKPIRQDLGEDLEITTIVPNRVLDSGETERVISGLREGFQDLVSPVHIRKRVSIPRAWRQGKTLFEHAPDSDMCPRFLELSEYIENRINTSNTTYTEVTHE
jgi:chromosome partitioning protein